MGMRTGQLKVIERSSTGQLGSSLKWHYRTVMPLSGCIL